MPNELKREKQEVPDNYWIGLLLAFAVSINGCNITDKLRDINNNLEKISIDISLMSNSLHEMKGKWETRNGVE